MRNKLNFMVHIALNGPRLNGFPTNQELKSQKKIELTRKQKNELKFLKFKIIGPQTNLWTKSTYTAG